MLQGSILGREPLRLLNCLALFYPLWLAQFLTGGNSRIEQDIHGMIVSLLF